MSSVGVSPTRKASLENFSTPLSHSSQVPSLLLVNIANSHSPGLVAPLMIPVVISQATDIVHPQRSPVYVDPILDLMFVVCLLTAMLPPLGSRP